MSVPVTPPKPWKIVGTRRGGADIIDRATGTRVGFVGHTEHSTWLAYIVPGLVTGVSGVSYVGEPRTRAEAAALVYQAWLDRTSEGSKK